MSEQHPGTVPTRRRDPRNRPTRAYLEGAMREGLEPSDDELDALVAEARPTDEAGYRDAVVAAVAELAEAWESGQLDDARNRAEELAAEIDEKHGAHDAREDAREADRDQRRAADAKENERIGRESVEKLERRPRL